MEAYKKIDEYKKLFKDGVISEEEFLKLKHMLFISNKQDLGIEDEDAFDNLIKEEQFKEAMNKLEVNTVESYSEAISILEDLGGWGSASIVAEQCRQDLQELKAQEELKKKEEFGSVDESSLQDGSNTIDVSETISVGADNNTITSSANAATQKVTEYVKRFKLTKKTVAIIAGVVLAIIILISVCTPKIDYYSITYDTASAYNGAYTHALEGHMTLYAVYVGGEEKEIDKNKWEIIDPSTLSAPETQITINYKGQKLYFDINVSY